MNHTPGPWIINEHAEICAKELYSQVILGRIYMGDNYPSEDDEWNATAELIAKAPDLLETSKELLTAMEQRQFFMEGYKNGSASISEVTAACDAESVAYSKLWNLIYKK